MGGSESEEETSTSAASTAITYDKSPLTIKSNRQPGTNDGGSTGAFAGNPLLEKSFEPKFNPLSLKYHQDVNKKASHSSSSDSEKRIGSRKKAKGITGPTYPRR